MEKKKYLFVVPSLSKGGAERVVSVLASELAQNGREAVIITHFRAEKEYPVSDNVKIICLSDLNEANYREKMSVTYLIRLEKMLRNAIVQQKPDYIIPFLWTTCIRTDLALLGLKWKKRAIQTVRNNPEIFPKNRVMKKYRNVLVKKSRLTIVQNEQQKKYFPENEWRKIKVLPNPVSSSLLKIERHESTERFKIVSVGRLESQKNFDLLIDAVACVIQKYENVILDIYGEGSMKEKLQEHINCLSLQQSVTLKGRSSNYDDMYGTASLFVLSSDFEGMPNTLLEAMAVGIPCISTDCPTGPSDIIESEKNGILVPTGNKEKLVQAIENLIQKEELRNDLSIMSKRTICSRYAPDKITEKFIDICEK